MNTIVVKGDHYSFLDKRKLEKAEIEDINIVMVFPSGFVVNFNTSKVLLDELTESDDAIIYGHIYVETSTL